MDSETHSLRTPPRKVHVTIDTAKDTFFDPYDAELNADAHPRCRRLREEAPQHYHEQNDSYAVGRFADLNQDIIDDETYTSTGYVFLERWVAQEEYLKRFTEWELDKGSASLPPASTLRDWDTTPTFVSRG